MTAPTPPGPASDDPIPPAVLEVLRERWRPPEYGSLFEYVWKEHPRRRADPSYYHHREGSDAGEGLRDADAVSLVKAGVFAGLARDHGDAVAINEHAEHALADLCGEVYEAWDRFQARLRSLPPRP